MQATVGRTRDHRAVDGCAAITGDSSYSARLTDVEAMRALSSVVLGDHSFEAVLQRATEVAQRTIPP
jgi:hypothetical protein